MTPIGYAGTMAAAVVALVGGAHILAPAPSDDVSPVMAYVRVIDGDTAVLPGGEHIRMLGFDAPEFHARCEREYTLAARATGRMWELAADGLTFERKGTDRYGRTLAVVRTKQGDDVARIMVGAGLARVYWGGRRRGWC